MITLSPAAVAKLQELVAEEGNPKLMLRAFVQGGGCSGFSYGFTFDEEQGEEDLIGLPRLAFHFNRRALGRLRMLIDFVNGRSG